MLRLGPGDFNLDPGNGTGVGNLHRVVVFGHHVEFRAESNRL